MLAVYHQSLPPECNLDFNEAESEVRSLASKLGVTRASIDAVLRGVNWTDRARPRYGDFGPGNLHGAADGALYLLDPPVESHTSVIHRDLANFLFETRRQLAGRGYTRSEKADIRFEEFRRGFLSGYLETSPGLAFNRPDEALIALFEAKRGAAMAMKRFPARPSDVLWFAGFTLRRRVALSSHARAARRTTQLS
jgi:hypothetical protein